ncbi:hypothetical protein DICPUDRAFT_160294 [Dictyostelium purpureum]|uniref:Nucleoporin Nup54 alpha-helical domain-containing protein n=1 Tax=Dictyostelium purpureum TaxID=5786 RepID=F1A633_DICPU|nr:uncharacterized protein DICPUDRAFT_160294 [Dictyostelium purpureum]EGC28350.1 hypothetical protein DICPUDRAFT_160294 [Dictyostelium purpureum]|eukprot:XP_003295127.1 hypothetical protein DICPUDRAFT_160294 [Dictyostelium purpureum]
MDALAINPSSTPSTSQSQPKQKSSTDIQDKEIRSPLEKFIKQKPAFVGRINLSNEFTQKEFLQTLISTKKKLYNLYIHSKELEFQLQERVKTLNEISQQQLKIIDVLRNRIENIKANQDLLNEKLKYAWNKKEICTEQVNQLYKSEMEGKPLSNAENDLKKNLRQIKGQVNIYSERLSQISNELDKNEENGINDNSIEYEPIPEDSHREIKKVLSLHDQKIEKDVNKLLNIFKTIQITK